LSNDSSLIIESLEIVAESAGDITSQVFDNYHRSCPASAKLMDHMDDYMLGRMMDQVLLLMMEEGEQELAAYLEFETKSHESYGVEHYMYDNLFEAVLTTVRQAAGKQWADRFQSAWERRINTLLQRITEAEAALH
jgi:hemoglobin-like flavoprotein